MKDGNQQADMFGGRMVWKGGYAGTPGQGPDGETCDTCKHCAVHRVSRVYYKCLMGSVTSGSASDIRLSAPACQFWEDA